jgi:hypothetical protein
MWMPYFLQLAHGWTKLLLRTNLVAILILVPLMIIGILQYGVMGGAATWLLLNAGYVVISPQLIHRKILVGEQWRWYGRDVLPVFTAAFTIVLLAKVLSRYVTGTIETAALIGASFVLATLAGALATQAGRGYLRFKRRAVTTS